MIDCSNCKNCYVHPIMWGEFWCNKKEKTSPTKDGYIYDSHCLKKRFKEECEDFEQKH